MAAEEVNHHLRGHQRRAVNPRALLAAGAVIGSLACAQAAGAAVGGGAFAVKANLNVLVVPVDIGPLPSVTLPPDGGGPLTASLLNTNLLGLVTIEAGKVSTQGKVGPGSAESSATVAHVSVAGLVQVTLASSTCSATTDGVGGSAKVVDLVVAGLPVAVVDLGPNTRISLPVGTVTINEQTPAAGAITVNAVHVQLNVLGLATGEVILAQSRCSAGPATHSVQRSHRRAHKRHRPASKPV